MVFITIRKIVAETADLLSSSWMEERDSECALINTLGSGSSGSNPMGVRVPPSAPSLLSNHFLWLHLSHWQSQSTHIFPENGICDIFVTFCLREWIKSISVERKKIPPQYWLLKGYCKRREETGAEDNGNLTVIDTPRGLSTVKSSIVQDN